MAIRHRYVLLCVLYELWQDIQKLINGIGVGEIIIDRRRKLYYIFFIPGIKELNYSFTRYLMSKKL